MLDTSRRASRYNYTQYTMCMALGSASYSCDVDLGRLIQRSRDSFPKLLLEGAANERGIVGVQGNKRHLFKTLRSATCAEL